jgi:hypothetical protein
MGFRVFGKETNDRRDEILKGRKQLLRRQEYDRRLFGDEDYVPSSDLLSAEQLKFLDDDMAVGFGFLTSQGDVFTRKVLLGGKPGEKEYDVARRYYDLLGTIEDSLHEHVQVKDASEIYRGVGDYADSTGTMKLSAFFEEFEKTGKARSFNIALNASYSQTKQYAEDFMETPDAMLLKVHTAEGVRMMSVSRYMERERLMIHGSAFEPISVTRRGDGRMEVELRLLERGTKADLTFGAVSPEAYSPFQDSSAKFPKDGSTPLLSSGGGVPASGTISPIFSVR